MWLGVFLQMLQAEVAQAGDWKVSPRKIYFVTLCVATSVFVLLQIDPYTALGIYPIQWQTFLGWFGTSLLVSAVCAALYLFVLVLYGQHHLEVPSCLTYSYFIANAAGITLVFISSMIGATTDNQFWFSITGWMIIIQELVITIGQTWSLTKVDLVLKSLEKNGFDYRTQRRKLLVFRIAIVAICIAAVTNQLTGVYSPLRLTYGVHIKDLDLSACNINVIAGDFLSLVAMAVLWNTFRRPSNANSNSHKTERLDASKLSTAPSRADVV